MMTVKYWYTSSGCMHMKSEKHLLPDFFEEDLKELKSYKNFEKIEIKSANNISVDIDLKTIFQCGGYSNKRGLYCDVF